MTLYNSADDSHDMLKEARHKRVYTIFSSYINYKNWLLEMVTFGNEGSGTIEDF